MLTLFQACILGLLQGITELFPISSLGHTVIFPSLFGWSINQSDPAFVTFIVVTHLATAFVLLGFFWADWKKILGGVFRSLRIRHVDMADTYARIGWLLVVSSVPVGILGILFEKQFSTLFAFPFFAGCFLIGNGIVLYGAELLRRRRTLENGQNNNDGRIARLSWANALWIGCMQCLALFPGFSRTGTTLAGGLLAGLPHPQAARYAFFLATPIILAAALLKIPELVLSGESVSLAPFVVGAVSAAAGAYVSVRYLTRYFKTNTLTPFAYYCVAMGLLTIILVLR